MRNLKELRNNVEVDSSRAVAVIRLFKETSVVRNDNFLKIDRAAFKSAALDKIEQFLLSSLNGFVTDHLEIDGVSVASDFYINNRTDNAEFQPDFFALIETQGKHVDHDLTLKLRSIVIALTESITGNRVLFSENADDVLNQDEMDYINFYTKQFLAQNGCKNISDTLCIHAGFDDETGVQVDDKFSPSDAISENYHEIEGTAFLDGYRNSDYIVFLCDFAGKKSASKGFISDFPKIIQIAREHSDSNRVYYKGYEILEGPKKGSLHLTSIELTDQKDIF